MKMLNRNEYIYILKCNIKSIKKIVCSGCGNCWIRKVSKELDNLSNKEICVLYDNRKKFFKFISEYKYNNRKICVLIEWEILGVKELIEEFIKEFK